MKLNKYHLTNAISEIDYDSEVYVLFFETDKQNKHNLGMYIGFNKDSTLSTEYWSEQDECIGFSVSYNIEDKTFYI